MTTTASTVVVVCDPGSLDPERVALAGFLGGYRGLTRDAYALDLRQFVVFWHRRHLALFQVHCGDVETFGRELEVKGRATATIGRRLCMVTGFYCYAEDGTLIAQSPAARVRRPRIDCESHAIGLDSGEVGALLVAAGFGPIGPHTLRRAFITAALDAGVRCATSKRPYPTPPHQPPCATTGRAFRLIVMPPTSCPPTSPAPPADLTLGAPTKVCWRPELATAKQK